MPSAAAMAMSDTKNNLISNMWRCAAIPLYLVAIWQGFGVLGIALCSLVSEGTATIAATVRLRQSHGIPYRCTLWSASYVVVITVSASASVYLVVHRFGFLLTGLTLGLWLSIAMLTARIVFPRVFRFNWDLSSIILK
jgi:hypothetical protein